MRRLWPLCGLSVMLLAGEAGAQGADALRVEQIRQDVRELQRVVRAQERRIAELERELARRSGAPPARGAANGSNDAETAPPLWLTRGRWDRIKPGMTEAEVVELLGPPTSMRRENEVRVVMLYALELEGAGFLGGSVGLEQGRVIQVAPPALK